MSETTKANEDLASSTYDQRNGQVSKNGEVSKNAGTPKNPESEGAATGPKDTVTGQVQETPDEPSDRPGTEAEEARR